MGLPARTIGLYAAQPAEPDLAMLLQHPRENFFAIRAWRGAELRISSAVDPLTILAPAKWGVLEPTTRLHARGCVQRSIC